MNAQPVNNGPLSPQDLRYGPPGSGGASKMRAATARQGPAATQRHTNTPLTIQTSGGGFQSGRTGQQSNQIQTSSSGSVDRSNKQAPRGSYRVGVMTSTNMSGAMRKGNQTTVAMAGAQGSYTPTQSHGQNTRKMQFGTTSNTISKTPN